MRYWCDWNKHATARHALVAGKTFLCYPSADSTSGKPEIKHVFISALLIVEDQFVGLASRTYWDNLIHDLVRANCCCLTLLLRPPLISLHLWICSDVDSVSLVFEVSAIGYTTELFAHKLPSSSIPKVRRMHSGRIHTPVKDQLILYSLNRKATKH